MNRKAKYLGLLILISILVSIGLFVITPTVKGSINSRDGNPITAKITISGLGEEESEPQIYLTEANEEGKFAFSNVRPGIYLLSYETFDQQVYFMKGHFVIKPGTKIDRARNVRGFKQFLGPSWFRQVKAALSHPPRASTGVMIVAAKRAARGTACAPYGQSDSFLGSRQFRQSGVLSFHLVVDAYRTKVGGQHGNPAR